MNYMDYCAILCGKIFLSILAILTINQTCSAGNVSSGTNMNFGKDVHGYYIMHINDTPAVKSLSVGDNLPSLTLTNVINYFSSQLKLDDFKGKYIIMDFWSTGCAGCISAWPKLIELQKKFENKLQIILINSWEGQGLVRKMFQNRKKMAGVDVRLPAMCGPENILKNLFSISGLPFVVWVSDKGQIKSITDGSAVNAENIEAMINGKDLSISQYLGMNQMIFVKDYGKPVFADGNGGTVKHLFSQSTFAQGQETLAYQYISYARKGAGYAIFSNQPVKEQYRLAYSNRFVPNDPEMTDSSLDLLMLNQVVLDVADTSKYVSHINGAVVRDNLYAYQLISPPCTLEQLQKKMQEDLARYIGLQVSWEKRKMKCLVLTAQDTSLIAYKEGETRVYLTDKTLTHVIFNNVPIRYIIERLENIIPGYYYSAYPLVDETGFKGKVGLIDLEAELGNYKSLDRALRQYKMKLTLADRERKVLVLKEPIGFHFPFK